MAKTEMEIAQSAKDMVLQTIDVLDARRVGMYCDLNGIALVIEDGYVVDVVPG